MSFATLPGERSNDRAARLLSVVAAVVVAAAIASATLLTASARRDNLLDEQRDDVSRVLSRAQTSIELTVNAHSSVAATVSAWVENLGRTPTQEEFDRFARLLLAAQPDLRAVELAPDGIIEFVTPLRGNEQALGLDLNDHPTGRATMEALRGGAPVVIEGPMNLAQGGQGLLLRHRVDIDHDGNPATPPRFFGAAVTLVDFPAVVRSAGLDDPTISWQIDRVPGGAGELIGTPQVGREPMAFQVRVPGGRWVLAGSPTEGWATSWARHVPYITGGLVLAVLVGIVLWGTMSEPRRLRRKVTQATAELARSNAHTASVMNAASDAILALDPDGYLLASNPATWRLLAVEPDELDGQAFAAMVPLDQVPLERRPDDGYLTGRATVRVSRGDGSSFPAEVAVAGAPGGAVRTVIIRDVTERERTTEDLRRHSQELERLNAGLRELDQVKRDFMAVASHEIRTPITAIRGFAVTLSRHWESLPEEDRRRSLDVIHRQATRLWHLVNDVLTTSQIEGGQVSSRAVPVHVASAVDRAIVDSQIPPNHVTSRVPPNLTASIDREHLTRILVAFLTNAAKYGEAPVEVAAELTVDGLVVAVRDHGDGVPAEFLQQMFEPFSQASTGERRTAVGTGLGLSVARGLARASGGDIWYERHPAGGSIFHLRLPVAGLGDSQAGREAAARAGSMSVMPDPATHPTGTATAPPADGEGDAVDSGLPADAVAAGVEADAVDADGQAVTRS